MSKTTTTPEVPEYDGIESWDEIINIGQPPVKRTAKINMTSEEVKKFLGEHDPNLYFREGKIPNWYKEFGVLLGEDEEETRTLRAVCHDMPELLLFKHKNQPLYNVLVPKPLSEHELTPQGDMTHAENIADMRAIAFGGTGQPRNYEKTYFRMRTGVINNHLRKGLDRLKEWRAHRDSNLDK